MGQRQETGWGFGTKRFLERPVSDSGVLGVAGVSCCPASGSCTYIPVGKLAFEVCGVFVGEEEKGEFRLRISH